MSVASRYFVASFACISMLCQSMPSLAGAIGGSGVTSYSNSESGWVQKLRKRHKIGIEYGWDNQVFQDLLKGFLAGRIISNVVEASAPNASVIKDAEALAEIVSGIQQEIERIKYADQNGIDFRFVNGAVRTALELGLKKAEQAKVVPPGTNLAVDVGKIVAAFAAAYAWGFMFG